MVLYYAFGGGLGHLARADAVMHTLGFDENSYLILTSSNYSNIIFERNNVIRLPEGLYSKTLELKSTIENIIKTKKIHSFYIDSFPGGINGELNNLHLKNCQFFYIARLLNWANYQRFTINFTLKYETTYIIENLQSEQLDFINQYAVNSQTIKLIYPKPGNLKAVNQVLTKIEKPIWLIVHSGSFDELKQLYKYAFDLAELEQINPFYLVISQTSSKLEFKLGIQMEYYPAIDFFPFVDRIFTACGYNSIAQTVEYIDIHHFIPFERKFDDQFTRAKARKILINRNKA